VIPLKNLNDIFSGVDHVLNSAKHGNFEEVLTKTKNYAEQATKKSSERIEISKKKIELLDSKSKLSKAYEAFGRLQYDAYSGESVSEDDIQAKIQEIQLLKSRAELLEAEINRLHEEFIETLTNREARREAKKNADEDIDIEAEASETE
jgi:hypothetical protein